MRSQANDHHPDLRAALYHLLSSGGKRIRAALTLLCGILLQADPDRLVTLAAAIELLHTATLVHDDLIDGALIRRGEPTINTRWSPAATVLTGDYLFARAAKLAAETCSIPAMLLFSETLAIIVNGEVTQLFGRRGISSRDDYERRIYSKTASLFEAATGSAAMLVTEDEAILGRLRNFGRGIGMAFQIVDDILDYTGDQVSIGKPVANDLRQGIFTLPAMYYYQSFPNDPDLERIVKANKIDESSLERLLVSIRQSGAIQSALDDAQNFVAHASQQLSSFSDCPEKQGLLELAHYIVDRQF